MAAPPYPKLDLLVHLYRTDSTNTPAGSGTMTLDDGWSTGTIQLEVDGNPISGDFGGALVTPKNLTLLELGPVGPFTVALTLLQNPYQASVSFAGSVSADGTYNATFVQPSE